MAKKTGSVHLEEKVWDFIDAFKEDNKISSRSTALEWIILSFMVGQSKSIGLEIKSNIDIPNIGVKNSSKMDNALDQIEDDMPE